MVGIKNDTMLEHKRQVLREKIKDLNRLDHKSQEYKFIREEMEYIAYDIANQDKKSGSTK